MSTSTESIESIGGRVPEASAPASHVAGRQTRLRALRSEWIKLTTTKSVLLTLVATVIVMAVVGIIAAGTVTGDLSTPQGSAAPPPPINVTLPLSIALAGANLAVLIIGVLGVVVGAREHTSGLIRTTFASVPRRTRVLGSQIGAFVGLVLPVMTLGSVVGFFGTMAVLEANDAATLTWSDPGVARAVIGTAVYVTAVGVMGICLGQLMRALGAGIGVLLAGIMIIPGLGAMVLPDDWDGVLAYLPSSAADAFTTMSGQDLLSPGTGMAVLATWVVALVVGAGLRLKRRDA